MRLFPQDYDVKVGSQKTGDTAKDEIAFDAVRVGPQQTVHVRLISEWGPYRVERIVLDSGVPDDAVVSDFKVGKNSQFWSVGEIPASFFVEGGGDERSLRVDVLPRGGASCPELE